MAMRAFNLQSFVLLAFFPFSSVFFPLVAQGNCDTGVRIEGTTVDHSGASIPSASISADNGQTTVADSAGRFVFACLPKTFSLRVQATGFADAMIRQSAGTQGVLRLKVTLAIAEVRTDVQVTANNTMTLDPDQGPATVALNTETIRQLADDPDDLLRQLQVLAAEAGGDPSATQITVDGFQEATVLPPKGSIASIRVNPDLFSSEYRWPPFSGGLIEIVTKPGASSLHGSLFFTGSDGLWNATTAFAPSSTPASKRRYGFEASGALIPRRSDFSMSLEKRDIDEFQVVNAETLSSDYVVTPFRQTVPTPQRLWMGLFRNGWQLTSGDTLTAVFTANVNRLGNQGVSALVLPESGYTSYASKYDLRFSNALTVGSGQLHQTRLGFTWWRTQDTPNSTTPSLQVAGYFTSGGAINQSVNDHGFNIEFDHDVLITKGRSSLKVGTQMQTLLTRNYEPNTFNGAWLFSSKSAPVLDANGNPTTAATTIDGMEAYRRTILGLAGSGPTTYQVTTGDPSVPFTQWMQALYAEETLQLAKRITTAGGLRYQAQSVPDSFANFEPRLGFAWSPDKQSKWVLHARAGIFNDPNLARDMADVLRLNGERQHEATIYSPSYSNPLGEAPGSIAVSTRKVFAPSLSEKSTAAAYFNIERAFPHQWQARVNFYRGADWNTVRMRNINAPMVATTIGTAPDPTAALLAPRPYGGNENILRYENSGHLTGNVVSMSLDQHSYKRFQFHASYRHMNFKANGGDGIVSPQSSYSEAGESARADWLKYNAGSFFGSLILPAKLEVAAQFDASTGAAYTITTGTDANGDGVLNDRPSYATAAMPGVTYQTRYGLMTANTTNGDVPRNVGTMPSTVHLDMNLSRALILNPKDKEHQRTLTLNVRSANILNHTNVNGVGTIVSSPSLDKPYQAEPARRVEAGIRFSF